MLSKLRSLVVATLVGVIVAAATHTGLDAQSGFLYSINGLKYSWPAAHASGPFANNGSGTLSWGGNTIQTNTVMYTTSGSCPSGWTEYTTGRGRYIVGLPSGGTNGATVGVVLGNVESRAAGTHGHTSSATVLFTATHIHGVTDPGHTHGGQVRTRGSENSPLSTGNELVMGFGNATGFKVTGITVTSGTSNVTVNTATLTVNNSVTTPGTNAPYIQLMGCQRS